MKRAVAFFLTILVILTGCSSKPQAKKIDKYSYEFFGAFDTVIQFMGYFEDEDHFKEFVQKGQARFEELHKLYDVYNNYDGVNNIKVINDNAGIKPVEVEQEILDLILFSKEWYGKTDGTVNIALGPVLSIWHDYREEGIDDPENAKLPPMELLKEGKLKSDINKVIVDSSKKTVFLQEPGMKLDVGAVAKGFATEIVARELMDAGFDSFIINSGGNIRAVGKPLDGVRNKWGVGIQNPDENPLIPDTPSLDTAFIDNGSLVTSGDYQRYYVVNGERFHHLIDPSTLMPANHYRAVTVMTRDSGLADFMSSAVFLQPFDESKALVEKIEGLEALWIMKDGTMEATEGMKKVLKEMGGASNK